MTLPLPAPVVTLRPGEKPSAARMAEILAFIQEDLDTISLQLPVTPTTLAAMALPTEALPTTNLFKGRRILYVADKTNGILWDLVYNGEGEFPWKKVGGPPLFIEVPAQEGTTSATYVNLTTKGPELTFPLKGDYYGTLGASIWNNTANCHARMGLSINGAEPTVELDANQPTAGAFSATFTYRRFKLTKMVAAQTALAKYRQISGGEAAFVGRSLQLDPIRVG